MLIIISLFTLCTAHGEKNLAVGAGFSAVGQRYYLLEQDTSALTTEPAVLFDGDYSRQTGKHKITADISGNIGTQSSWFNLGGRWKLSAGKISIQTGEKLETRFTYLSGEDIPEYFKHRFSLKLEQKSKSSAINARLWVENKKFLQQSEFCYDYSLLKSEVKYKLSTRQWNYTFGWTYSFRNVPDSADANYDRTQVDLSASQIDESGKMWDINLEYDSKNFPSEDRRGSYTAFYLTSDNSIPIRTIFFDFSFDGEVRNYAVEDEIYYDYALLSVKSRLQGDVDEFSIGAGPLFTIQHCPQNYDGTSFTEAGISLTGNFLNYKEIWFTAEINVGKRFYHSLPDSTFFSDYIFVDLTTMLSIWFARRWRADLSAFYSPQWHQRTTDDVRTSYVLLTVKYEVF